MFPVLQRLNIGRQKQFGMGKTQFCLMISEFSCSAAVYSRLSNQEKRQAEGLAHVEQAEAEGIVQGAMAFLPVLVMAARIFDFDIKVYHQYGDRVSNPLLYPAASHTVLCSLSLLTLVVLIS